MSKKAKKIKTMKSFVAPSVLPVMYLDSLTKAEQDQRRLSKQRSRKLLAEASGPGDKFDLPEQKGGEDSEDFETRASEHSKMIIDEMEKIYGEEHVHKLMAEQPEFWNDASLLRRIFVIEKAKIAMSPQEKGEAIDDFNKRTGEYLNGRRKFYEAFVVTESEMPDNPRQAVEEFLESLKDNWDDQKNDWILRRLHGADDEETFENYQAKLREEIEQQRIKLRGAKNQNLDGRLAHLFAHQQWDDDYLMLGKEERERQTHPTRGHVGDDGNQSKNGLPRRNSDVGDRTPPPEQAMGGSRIGNHQNTSSAGMRKRISVNQFLVLVLFVLYVAVYIKS